jgi:hypothetical protein
MMYRAKIRVQVKVKIRVKVTYITGYSLPWREGRRRFHTPEKGIKIIS